MGVILNKSLSPWNCDTCQKEVTYGESIRHGFYCSDCSLLVSESAEGPDLSGPLDFSEQPGSEISEDGQVSEEQIA